MSPLESALVAIVSPARRRPPLSVELTTRYDPDYLTGIFANMAKPRPLHHPFFIGARLEVLDATRWRYDELDEAGDVVLSAGYDGSRGWSQAGHGSRNEWTPTISDDPRELPDSAWQFHASLVMREVVEPVLMLPALAIEDATPQSSDYGAAVRLLGRPQLADRIESALVSISAKTCLVDIHQETGIVIEATNLDAAGDILVRHTVETLQFGG